MELMDFVIKVASQHKAMTLLAGCIGIAVSIALAVRIEIASKAVAYAVMCTLLILATLLWMLAAARGKGIIWDTLIAPEWAKEPLLSDWNNLAIRCEAHLYFYKYHIEESGYHNLCKAVYVILWAIMISLYVYAFSRMDLEPLQLALLATSTILATGLNCTSYYFCCLCVWFIAELSKLDSLRALPGFQHLPRLSSVVQKLERTNTHNTNSFLLVSLMLSIVILAGVFMSDNGARDTVMVLTMFTVLVVGFVTFAVLFACARLYINQLTDKWANAALVELERADANGGPDALRDALPDPDALEQLQNLEGTLRYGDRVSSTDKTMLLLTIATLAVNAVSMFLALAD